MKLTLLWPRSTADAELAAVAERYFSRIKHFFPIEIIEVVPRRGRQTESDVAIMRAHSALLLRAIPAQGHVVALDERGRSIDSLKFAKWLERLMIDQPHGVIFVMGGDVGLDQSVRQRADDVLCLSAMTLPHQLARVVLLEQIYRACTLMRNIPYHK
ncbi:MAG TPA: 23S rRNA (pseudouridine(1915)-N(3))-methyltransferase RlmH [Thermoanaerobaculia bacterium]|jgi:23S rRNA (pseudouridine1915-N3)-methyltransferase|nr:23S rRNA (pseudouridine(1915)-N(3))-methyltransferase RlmH [Thermoanaerobaculia bacterium]